MHVLSRERRLRQPGCLLQHTYTSPLSPCSARGRDHWKVLIQPGRTAARAATAPETWPHCRSCRHRSGDPAALPLVPPPLRRPAPPSAATAPTALVPAPAPVHTWNDSLFRRRHAYLERPPPLAPHAYLERQPPPPARLDVVQPQRPGGRVARVGKLAAPCRRLLRIDCVQRAPRDEDLPAHFQERRHRRQVRAAGIGGRGEPRRQAVDGRRVVRDVFSDAAIAACGGLRGAWRSKRGSAALRGRAGDVQRLWFSGDVQ
eukprot:194754-Chlamydomonas_euryale.AAC.4